MAPKRLFLALWPDAEIRHQIADISTQLPGGRQVAKANLHLTLLFLGTTSARQQAEYETKLAQVSGTPFCLLLDRLGFWRRSGIVWLGCSQLPTELKELLAQFAAAGLDLPKRPFQAHVTLARKYPSQAWPAHAWPLSQSQGIKWPVNSFHLMESQFGCHSVYYHTLRVWTL